MLIRIKMHLILLTTISLLFVWEGHFWIILKKGSPPPSARACTHMYIQNTAGGHEAHLRDMTDSP